MSLQDSNPFLFKCKTEEKMSRAAEWPRSSPKNECVRSLLLETDPEMEDLISSMGPRTLDLNDENLSFYDEEERFKGDV